MRKLVLLIMLTAILSSCGEIPAISYGEHFSGNDALEMGQEFDRYNKDKSFNKSQCGVYMGLVGGVYSSTEWIYKKQDLRLNQLCQIAYKYLKTSKPDSLKLGAAYNIQWAFINAFGWNEKNFDLWTKLMHDTVTGQHLLKK